MNPTTLPHPDSHHVSAAAGWLDLGNPAEARTELGQVSAPSRAHPDYLETAWLVHASMGDWEQGLAVAGQLVEVAPGLPTGWLHRAYALRRVQGGGVGAARAALLPAAARFSGECTIPYNLACYACLLDDLDGARDWLRRAVTIAGRDSIRAMALRDDDLRPLRGEIEQW